MKSSILRSRRARLAVISTERVAKSVASLCAGNKRIEEKYDEIRVLLDRELKRNEYFVIIDHNGLGVIHTNRLREGSMFQDEVGRKAAMTTETISQLYRRDTGEWLIDTAVPIGSIGGKSYVLRMGKLIHRPFLAPVIIGLGVIPSLVSIPVAMAGGTGLSAMMLVAGSSLVIGLAGGWGVYQHLHKQLAAWLGMTRMVSAGNLTVRIDSAARDEFHQMGLELNKMVLGMKNIIAEIANSSKTTRAISQQQARQAEGLAETFEELTGVVGEFQAGASQQAAGTRGAMERLDQVLARL
ncbi:MAG: hypothetical protein ACM32O_13970, partial [Clostridia bacterium]